MKRHLLVLAAAIASAAAGMTAGAAGTAAAPSHEIKGTPLTVGGGVAESVASMKAREARTTPNLATPSATPRQQPGRRNLPQNPASAGIRSTPQPSKPIPTGPYIAAQTTATQFTGAQLSDSGFVPPDSMGAVGPTQFIVSVNQRIRSFDKATGIADGVLDMNTDSFFNLVRNGSATSDPHIRYDRLSGRWFITMVNTGTPSNRVLVAFSNTSTISPATTFTERFVDIINVHAGCIWDYDTLGIDASALYIGGNIFCGPSNPPSLVQSDAMVMSKPNLLAGNPTAAVFAVATNIVNPTTCGNGPYTPQGVDNSDPYATVGYFAGVSACNFGELDFVRITNPASSQPSATPLAPLAVAQTYFPIPVPALGTDARGLDALDDRLFMAQLRNGHLWTAHNVGVDATGTSPPAQNGNLVDRDATRWYDVTNLGGTPSLAQSGTIFDASVTNPNSFWMPSIMVSGQGHAALGLNRAGAARRPDAVTVGRFAGDAAGTLRDMVVYQTSGFDYSPSEQGTAAHRWGDYSYTSLDPNDDMTMWTIQEYINATDSWGVRAVKLVAPPPATPASADTTLNADQCSQQVGVTGTSTNGSGFYDPGPGFANRLQATVSGGVTVHRVNYVDPTHITLDVSTQGAGPGTKNLTITNPDGQSVTVNNFLTVGGPSAQLNTETAVSGSQYTLRNSNGSTWVEIDPSLRVSCAPVANQSILLTGNADLFTGDAGFNQDVGIFYSDNGGADQLLGWKESGGFAGTFSPNAAFVQTLFAMTGGHSYVFKLKWKTNKPAGGATIFAGAGGGLPFSPTSLIGQSFPTGVTPNFATSNQQYTLPNSDGSTFVDIDPVNLQTTLSPGANSTAVLGANVDLFTGNAGYNQDVGIFVSDNGGADQLVAWKESGGFAGIFSPNAAFVKATFPMTGGHTYLFKMKWKTNKNAPGVTIFAAAGGNGGPVSPTTLYAQSIPAGNNPFTQVSTAQYTLPNSNGSTWVEPDTSLRVTVAPGSITNSRLGANIDLFTGNAGFNQDVAIFVSDNGGADQLLAWKESGGFGGVFSPNAAYVQSGFRMLAGHTYVFKLKWKTNKPAGGATIFAGAGPRLPGEYSPTRLIVELTG